MQSINNKSKTAELLAPAGDWDSLVAAIENGADAVYIGGKSFSARSFSANFDQEAIRRAIDYVHARNAKLYLAVNTLISDREIEQAVNDVAFAYAEGLDAVIVQDLGFASVIRKYLPKLDLHASTQMTIYNLDGAKTLHRLGFKRVILARELSIPEIKSISAASPIETEVFVHGALCISYSGQCLMSSVIGARSGNRGKCAQPCRLPYSLIKDGKCLDPKEQHLLSPKDLCSLPVLREVTHTGVASIKIEGRMKTPDYVGTAVRTYRKYLDDLSLALDKNDVKELLEKFSRGGSCLGYLEGKQGKDMMCYQNLPKVQSACTSPSGHKKLPISGCLAIKKDVLPTLTVWNEDGLVADAIGANPPSPAKTKPLTRGILSTQINKTGDTPFTFSDIAIDLDEGLSLPVSEINALRREALKALEEKIVTAKKRDPQAAFVLSKSGIANGKRTHHMKISVMCYKFDPKFLSLPVDRIYIPLKEFLALGDSAKATKAEVFVTLPQITRGNCDKLIKSNLDKIRNHAAGVLVGNLGGIEQAKGLKIHADNTLNLFNSFTQEELTGLNLSGGTLSVELSLDQVKGLTNVEGFEKEMVVYGRIPLMVSEYCPVGALEGGFKSGTPCSHPCGKAHSYILKDRIGKEFPVICDSLDCRSSILNADTLFLADKLDKIKASGVDTLRLNITTESVSQVKDIVDMHRDVCDNGIQALSKYQDLVDSIKKKGFTRGHFQRGV